MRELRTKIIRNIINGKEKRGSIEERIKTTTGEERTHNTDTTAENQKTPTATKLKKGAKNTTQQTIGGSRCDLVKQNKILRERHYKRKNYYDECIQGDSYRGKDVCFGPGVSCPLCVFFFY